MKHIRTAIAAAVAVAGFGLGSAQAALTQFQSFVGTYGVSTDGFGSTTQAGNISAFVPAGATVTAAYLYSSMFNTGTPGGTLAGSGVSYTTALGVNVGLQAWRADVTSIVAPLIDGGPGGTYNFRVTETSASQDGEALVVVYSLPSLPISTVAILDGFSASAGDATAINFSSPLDPAAAGFFAEMRLGIGFSFNGNPCGASSSQTSQVTVNGTTITQSAGCNDDSADAAAANGNLITVGGSDDPFSALLPTVAADRERYNLVPYLSAGDTSIAIRTVNPSRDDNIFLAVFNVFGAAGFNEPPPPPPNPVPAPATLGLLGLGLLGFGAHRRLARRG